jgi:hypothetical protein
VRRRRERWSAREKEKERREKRPIDCRNKKKPRGNNSSISTAFQRTQRSRRARRSSGRGKACPGRRQPAAPGCWRLAFLEDQKKKVFENSESALLLLFCFFFSFAPPCKSLAEHSGARGETERCLDSARSGREREIREERKREREAWSGRERKREGRFFLLREASLTKRGKKKVERLERRGERERERKKNHFSFARQRASETPILRAAGTGRAARRFTLNSRWQAPALLRRSLRTRI